MADCTDPAAVCLFAFNRPDHTRRTLAALAASPLAEATDLIAYLDGPRDDEDVDLVNQVADVITAQTGFASIDLRHREENAGLAVSIQDGVTETMQARGRAIVLEDDIVTSPAFLSYMNLALQRYRQENRVWHISGYSEAIAANHDRPGAHLWRFMSCWGWASWADRWQHFERDPLGLMDSFTAQDIHRFNLNGAENFWAQVEGNARGDMKTWAVFWYATIFRHQGLCLAPYHSYAENIGFDGSGTHASPWNARRQGGLNQDFAPLLPTVIEEDTEALEQLRTHYMYRPSKLTKLKRKLGRFLKR